MKISLFAADVFSSGTGSVFVEPFVSDLISKVKKILLLRTSECFVFYLKHNDQNIQNCVILPVVLYRCETWSLALREKRR